MKSDVEIAKFVWCEVKGTELENTVSGKLSDRGRPAGSDKEDIVISVLSNEGCGQKQRARVNVNIYVSDLWNAENKAWETDTERVSELCNLSKFLSFLHQAGIHTRPSSCSQKVYPTGAAFEDGHTEHFINNNLYLEMCNEFVI